jgi:transposase
MKYESQITDSNQWLRLKIAFNRYPELEKSWRHAQRLRTVFTHEDPNRAEEALDKWIKETTDGDHRTFQSAANSIRWHKQTILNFFDNRSTNASAESFNARIKQFRANQKGVRNTKFFLYRLSKLYA